MGDIVNYYYCPDYKKYVREDTGLFFAIEDGREEYAPTFLPIIMGKIFTRDITKEDYEKHLEIKEPIDVILERWKERKKRYGVLFS